jgi:hypothetical protein
MEVAAFAQAIAQYLIQRLGCEHTGKKMSGLDIDGILIRAMQTAIMLKSLIRKEDWIATNSSI